MYLTPGNDLNTVGKPEVYMYLDYIYIERKKDLCVCLDLNVQAVYIFIKYPNCGEKNQF